MNIKSIVENQIITLCIARLHIVLLLILSLSVISCGGSGGHSNVSPPNWPSTDPGNSTPPNTSDEEFTTMLTRILTEYSLPAAAAVLMHNDEIIYQNAVGVRSLNNSIAVSIDDHWHLGSISKSMTATLAAILVEKGMISWDTMLVDVFPTLVLQGNGHFDFVTLEQLLSHSAGIQRDLNWTDFVDSTADITELRRDVVAEALTTQPANNGDSFHYSNLGFVIAGAMLEAVAQKSWEELMQEELFLPLQIEDAGFGAPQGVASNPSGHRAGGNSYIAVDPASLASDNPAVIGPAGTVNMSLSSLAKYAYAHMVGELGESTLLSSDGFVKLHESVGGSDYALGWFVQPGSLFHDGSNTLWFAKLGISVDQQLIVISVTNAGGQNANDATDKITNGMLSIFTGQ